MAAGTMSKPGARFGPCVAADCGHRDCDQTRRMAAVVCRFCGEPIGYDRPFYAETPGDDSTLVHAVCLEDAVEAAARKETAAACRPS